MTKNAHHITTSTGRVLKIELDTARTLEAVGLSADQIDLDIDGLIAGRSAAALLGACQDGAEDEATLAAWSDYVTECVRLADGELLARQSA